MEMLVSCVVYVGLPLLGLLFPAEAMTFKQWKKSRMIEKLRRERDKRIVWVKIRIRKGDKWY